MRRMAFLSLWAAILVLASLSGQSRAKASPPLSGEAAYLCRDIIGHAENELDIPQHLLQAVALVESGRTVPLTAEEEKTFTAWPWTVMAEGRGRYLPTKQAAIEEVRKLQKQGVTNIDVGCMQVNLHYHGKAFTSLEQAFDPVHNIAYAATFLSKLRQDRRSWTMAVKYYHSSDRERQSYYRNKVFTTWRNLQKEARHSRAPASSKASPGWAAVPARRPLFSDYKSQLRQQAQARLLALSEPSDN